MAEQLRTFLRLKQVTAVTGLSRSWTYDAIAKGLFVKPILLSARAVGWPSDEVAAINAARIAGKTNDEIIELVMQLEAARKGVTL
jgi:prophage regulatory protein